MKRKAVIIGKRSLDIEKAGSGILVLAIFMTQELRRALRQGDKHSKSCEPFMHRSAAACLLAAPYGLIEK